MYNLHMYIHRCICEEVCTYICAYIHWHLKNFLQARDFRGLLLLLSVKLSGKLKMNITMSITNISLFVNMKALAQFHYCYQRITQLHEKIGSCDLFDTTSDAKWGACCHFLRRGSHKRVIWPWSMSPLCMRGQMITRQQVIIVTREMRERHFVKMIKMPSCGRWK